MGPDRGVCSLPSVGGECWVAVRRGSKLRVSSSVSPKLTLSNRYDVLVLTVGDSIIRNVGTAFRDSTSVECFPGDSVLDISAQMENLAGNHKQTSTVIVHVGTNHMRLRESETLKKHFKSLGRNTVISGPLLVIRRGCELFSRLYSLSVKRGSRLSKWYASEKLGFVDNWDSFWERPGFFKRDGLHPNRRDLFRLIEHIGNYFNNL
ncbi:hypothetical protein AOXY_G2300 [Acipenser oxyrinchus oxyrinchus]|uniref:SGNH hydrolase-type esterase domain-containing protein n=1 Tax=Acipenser oxyrinchus oxyrinchus TaxID=40147 RepID=A0AAD8LU30_ACIOX|nr:hypothetical protein AOXY_G2300 [Acipenser oxyrinchus oxyrinchus]